MKFASQSHRRLNSVAVRDLDVQNAISIVDKSGVPDILEREMRRTRGRPRVHAWRSVLALLLLGAIQQATAVHVVHTQRVWWGLTERQKAILGFDRDVSHTTLDGYLNDLLDATEEKVDMKTGAVLPARVSVPEIDLLHMLLLATVGGVQQPCNTVAIDSMPMEGWARRRGWQRDTKERVAKREQDRAKGRKVPEPPRISEPGWPKIRDDGTYQMSVDSEAYEVFEGSKNLQPSNIKVGYDLHVAADVSPLGESGFPPLPRGFVLATSSGDKHGALLTMIDSLRRLGVEVGKVAIDRGYSQIDGLGLELSKRRIEQVIKLKADQMGPHGTPVPGTIMIDGDLFVDWMPKDLWDLPNFTIGMSAEEIAALNARYEERVPYAFSPKGQRDWARGVQQYRGPAASGKVTCANRPESLRVTRAVECPSVGQLNRGEAVQPCACSAQPSLGPGDDLDLRQRYLYGTRKWLADYSRRSSVESSNANFTTHFSGLNERKAIRTFLGRRKRQWLACFGIIAVAIRLMHSRYEVAPSEVEEGHPVTNPVPKTPRRDKDGREKRTLNVQVFGRRKPRRQGRPTGGTPPASRPTGPPAWARTSTKSAGDSVR